MPACAISPKSKQEQAKKVGNDLIKHYGKKPYYSVEQVKASNKRQNIDIDLGCWSHAMFNSHTDFDIYHHAIGEVCDYAAMKSKMLDSVSNVHSESWFDFDLSWFDFPDIDWSFFNFLD